MENNNKKMPKKFFSLEIIKNLLFNTEIYYLFDFNFFYVHYIIILIFKTYHYYNVMSFLIT